MVLFLNLASVGVYVDRHTGPLLTLSAVRWVPSGPPLLLIAASREVPSEHPPLRWAPVTRRELTVSILGPSWRHKTTTRTAKKGLKINDPFL